MHIQFIVLEWYCKRSLQVLLPFNISFIRKLDNMVALSSIERGINLSESNCCQDLSLIICSVLS